MLPSTSRVHALAVLALAAGAAAGLAQPVVRLLDTDPPGVRDFGSGSFTLVYEVRGVAAGVEVTFARDDGVQTVVAIPDAANPPPPFRLVLPLKTNVDRAPNTFTAVARDLTTNQIGLSNSFTVRSDDIGPEPPVVTSPVFPANCVAGILQILGTARNEQPGVPDLPETAGRIVVRVPATGTVLGGGAILADSRFVAIANLTSLPFGVPTALEILAIDQAGNPGAPLVGQVTRVMASPATVAATLDPTDGAITRNPGVAIRGQVIGDGGRMTVHFFVDGLLESQTVGLEDRQEFLHTLNLPGEGAHAIAVQATYEGVPPEASLATTLGILTLDR